MIMIIYIHDGALYFLLCLSYAFYSYFATFAIFVPKNEGRGSVEHLQSQSNTKGRDLGDIWDKSWFKKKWRFSYFRGSSYI